MGADQNNDWHGTVASALDWWRAAGVDVEIADAPRDWLAAVAPRTQAAVDAAPAAVATTQLPATLAAFATWRTGEEAPERGWGAPLIPFGGPSDAPLMVLVEQPEREDADTGRLLSGKSGALFDRMLAAIGVGRDGVHIASIAAARPVSGRIPREAIDPLTAIARHYVGLAQPKALLLLGNGPCQVVLGELCQPARGSLRSVNHDGATMAGTAALASFHPQQLIERPQWKAEAWKDLLMLKKALEA